MLEFKAKKYSMSTQRVKVVIETSDENEHIITSELKKGKLNMTKQVLHAMCRMKKIA